MLSGPVNKPEELGDSEEAVYDLKDHPDFQYRPGSIVIKVGNHDKTDFGRGGQVLDNEVGGKVKVKWSQGHVDQCWPQDLYKIGEYDSDEEEGFWHDDVADDDGSGSGNDSWETESQESEVGDSAIPHPFSLGSDELEAQFVAFVAKMDDSVAKIRAKISLLMEQQQQQQQQHQQEVPKLSEVMQELKDLHEICLNMDSILGSEYFAPNNFEPDLLNRILDSNRLTRQKIADQTAKFRGDEQQQLQEEEKENLQICEEFCESLSRKMRVANRDAKRRLRLHRGLASIVDVASTFSSALNALTAFFTSSSAALQQDQDIDNGNNGELYLTCSLKVKGGSIKRGPLFICLCCEIRYGTTVDSAYSGHHGTSLKWL